MDVGGTEERGAHYYIHTRVRQGERGWMHQGNEEEIGGRTKFEKEKTLPSATIGLTFLWGLTKKSVIPLLGVTNKSASLPIKIKNYKLLSSVTLLDITT